MPRISAKNQITIPIAALREAGLRAGDRVVVEAFGEGELRVRGSAFHVDAGFGALTGTYPADYLRKLDAGDEPRRGR